MEQVILVDGRYVRLNEGNRLSFEKVKGGVRLTVKSKDGFYVSDPKGFPVIDVSPFWRG